MCWLRCAGCATVVAEVVGSSLLVQDLNQNAIRPNNISSAIIGNNQFERFSSTITGVGSTTGAWCNVRPAAVFTPKPASKGTAHCGSAAKMLSA
jgi:hypothetical protein